MILILGGTTEGRKAVGIAEEAGKTYYYSTKGDEQEISLQHGIRLTGALTQTTMKAFCRKNGIRLLVDAAHPFAEQLHATVTAVSQALGIPCVRYERMYDDLFKLFNEASNNNIIYCTAQGNIAIIFQLLQIVYNLYQYQPENRRKGGAPSNPRKLAQW